MLGNIYLERSQEYVNNIVSECLERLKDKPIGQSLVFILFPDYFGENYFENIFKDAGKKLKKHNIKLVIENDPDRAIFTKIG